MLFNNFNHMWYEYALKNSIKKDISTFQEQELLDDWYLYNEKEKTYDLYEEVKEKFTYVDFQYIDEIEMDVFLSEVEVYETGKVKNVSYKKKEKWILWFFKNIAQKFFPIKELNVSEERIKELEMMLARGEIQDLEIQEKIETKKERKFLSNKEISELDIQYTFIWKTKKTKKEKERILSSRVEKLKDFEEKYSDKEIIDRKDIVKEEVIEKIVIDRRRKISTDIYYYVPWVWSNWKNHWEGSMAEFSCDIEIEYISWFNPFDSRYLNRNELKEEVIEIIEEEHPTTGYIRARADRKDWFNIEDTRVY